MEVSAQNSESGTFSLCSCNNKPVITNWMAVAFSENNLLALADLMCYSSVPLIDNIAFGILCSAALQLLNRLLYGEKYSSLFFSLSFLPEGLF